MDLNEIYAAIQPGDQSVVAAAWKRWDSIAKPLRSLGLLEQAVAQIAGMRRTTAVQIQKPCVVAMCADNGVVEEGVTQTSQEITALVTENFTKGITTACMMAREAGTVVIPVDVGVARDVSGPGLRIHKVAYGTQNMTRGPAMTRAQAEQAILVGVETVRELAAEGYDLFATGEMGIGNTTTSSAVASVLLGQEPAVVTGRGAGLSSEGLARKISAVERAIACNQPNPADPLDVLAKVGGFDLAGLTGVFLGAALVQQPAMVDGFISAVAALCAVRLCPAVRDYILPSHVSKEPAGRMLLDALDLQPFLTCGMFLGEGTGAIAALPLLRMGCRVYNEVNVFSEIGMDEYQPLD